MSTYNKTVWQDGDIITADKMNNIENGIYSYNEDITNLQTNKQDALTFDQTPTDESTNPVTSVGIKNAIEAAVDVTAPGIYETASGSIASFADGADDLPMKSAVVSIEPIQEGEGDPSPENVRAISGRTGLSVVRMGKNLLDASKIVFKDHESDITRNGITLAKNSDGSFKLSGTATAQTRLTFKPDMTLVSGSYTLSVIGGTGSTLRFISSGNNGLEYTSAYLNGTFTKTYTVTDNATYEYMYLDVQNDATVNSTIYIQLEKGISATDYEPYKGSTVSVNWETEAGTVYGGTLDVVSGKLVVDRAKTTLDGTNTVGNVVEKDGFTNCRISGYTPAAKNYTTPSTKPNAVCSDAKLIAVYYAWQNQDISSANLFTVNGSYIGMSIPGSFADADAVKAYLTSHNVDVCYEIANPTEIQLTPQEVRTLLGENNIWSDAGSIAVEYPADTKMYIDQKITEAIAAAMA